MHYAKLKKLDIKGILQNSINMMFSKCKPIVADIRSAIARG